MSTPYKLDVGQVAGHRLGELPDGRAVRLHADGLDDGGAQAFGTRAVLAQDARGGAVLGGECEQDVAEGADVLMIKPALPYLDVIRAARERFDLPLAAYNVSGEYAMVKAAAAKGFLDERQAALESLTAIKRAGADFVISYWTKELATWL